eukprot:gene3271-4121_t
MAFPDHLQKLRLGQQNQLKLEQTLSRAATKKTPDSPTRDAKRSAPMLAKLLGGRTPLKHDGCVPLTDSQPVPPQTRPQPQSPESLKRPFPQPAPAKTPPPTAASELTAEQKLRISENKAKALQKRLERQQQEHAEAAVRAPPPRAAAPQAIAQPAVAASTSSKPSKVKFGAAAAPTGATEGKVQHVPAKARPTVTLQPLEDTVLVRGEGTFALKAQLQKLRGKFEPSAKSWVFPKEREVAVRLMLKNEHALVLDMAAIESFDALAAAATEATRLMTHREPLAQAQAPPAEPVVNSGGSSYFPIFSPSKRNAPAAVSAASSPPAAPPCDKKPTTPAPPAATPPDVKPTIPAPPAVPIASPHSASTAPLHPIETCTDSMIREMIRKYFQETDMTVATEKSARQHVSRMTGAASKHPRIKQLVKEEVNECLILLERELEKEEVMEIPGPRPATPEVIDLLDDDDDDDGQDCSVRPHGQAAPAPVCQEVLRKEFEANQERLEKSKEAVKAEELSTRVNKRRRIANNQQSENLLYPNSFFGGGGTSFDWGWEGMGSSDMGMDIR